MISGVPLFRGRDNNDQLLHIMRIIGTPTQAQFAKISKETVRPHNSNLYVIQPLTSQPLQPEIQPKQFPTYPKMPFHQVLPKASPQGW
jgi:hypothetical protein